MGVKLSSDSAPKCPFKQREVLGLVKRFMKEEAYVPSRDPMLFYRIWKLFPDEAFWRVYQLPFKLNCLAWFLGEDGRAQIKQDIALFHLNMTPATEYRMEDGKVGEDAAVTRPKTTVADLLR